MRVNMFDIVITGGTLLTMSAGMKIVEYPIPEAVSASGIRAAVPSLIQQCVNRFLMDYIGYNNVLSFPTICDRRKI